MAATPPKSRRRANPFAIVIGGLLLLIALSAIYVGLADPLTPPAAFAKARGELEAAYAAAGAAVGLAFHVESDTGHVETPAMRAAAVAFLGRHLG